MILGWNLYIDLQKAGVGDTPPPGGGPKKPPRAKRAAAPSPAPGAAPGAAAPKEPEGVATTPGQSTEGLKRKATAKLTPEEMKRVDHKSKSTKTSYLNPATDTPAAPEVEDEEDKPKKKKPGKSSQKLLVTPSGSLKPESNPDQLSIFSENTQAPTGSESVKKPDLLLATPSKAASSKAKRGKGAAKASAKTEPKPEPKTFEEALASWTSERDTNARAHAKHMSPHENKLKSVKNKLKEHKKNRPVPPEYMAKPLGADYPDLGGKVPADVTKKYEEYTAKVKAHKIADKNWSRTSRQLANAHARATGARDAALGSAPKFTSDKPTRAQFKGKVQAEKEAVAEAIDTNRGRLQAKSEEAKASESKQKKSSNEEASLAAKEFRAAARSKVSNAKDVESTQSKASNEEASLAAAQFKASQKAKAAAARKAKAAAPREAVSELDKIHAARHKDKATTLRDNIMSHITHTELSDSELSKLQDVHSKLDDHINLDKVPGSVHRARLKDLADRAGKHGKSAYEAPKPVTPKDVVNPREAVTSADKAKAQKHQDKATELRDNIRSHVASSNLSDDEFENLKDIHDKLDEHVNLGKVPGTKHTEDLRKLAKDAGKHGRTKANLEEAGPRPAKTDMDHAEMQSHRDRASEMQRNIASHLNSQDLSPGDRKKLETAHKELDKHVSISGVPGKAHDKDLSRISKVADKHGKKAHETAKAPEGPRVPVSDLDNAVVNKHTSDAKKTQDNIKHHLDNNQDLSDSQRKDLQAVHDALNDHVNMQHVPTAEHRKHLNTLKTLAGEHGKGVKPQKDPKEATSSSSLSSQFRSGVASGRAIGAAVTSESGGGRLGSMAVSGVPQGAVSMGHYLLNKDKKPSEDAKKEPEKKSGKGQVSQSSLDGKV